MRTIVMMAMLTALGALAGCSQESVPEALGKIQIDFDCKDGTCFPELMTQRPIRKLLDRSDVWEALFEQLENPEPSRCTCNGKPVPMGYLALYILLKNVDASQICAVYYDGGSEKLGPNIRRGYYFPPDLDPKSPKGQELMKAVRKSWTSLYTDTEGRLLTRQLKWMS